MKKIEIRNSTAEFLVFMAEGKENGVQVVYKDETIWCTQKAMATLFDVDKSGISRHIKKILSDGELSTDTTVAKIATVVNRGIRGEVEDELEYYNLDMVIAVGYRVNSRRATQFRQWCTFVLRQYAIRGYVIDKKRMENGSFIGVDYFEQLLEEIREIRLSERNFYQKLTDIYATAIDYNRDAPTTRDFFKKVQNKMHYAVHGHTAAELKLVNAYLDIAKDMAERHIPMTMEDWAKRIDKFLDATNRDILQGAGSITAEYAKQYAESEFEKYRVIQDRLFRSDFDLLNENQTTIPYEEL